MNKKILITGAKGFVGSNVAKHFKALGYETYGIGHGGLSVEESKEIGLDFWKKDNVFIKAILEFEQTFDVIVHCGGSGSVGFSIDYPYEDFKKTIDGTLEVLEYMRVYNPNAHLIYPSSPAVQGEHPDTPIQEDYIGKPASPYGYHKKIAEDLCQSYSEKYNLKVSIIRLFSVYGNGLKKQLLWDACQKIENAKEKVIFWGTGEETRDFIHINDVLFLFDILLKKEDRFVLINGGTGNKYNIKNVVEMIRDQINPSISIAFNNQVNTGNPIYYWADTQKLKNYGFKAVKGFEQEIKNYVEWAKDLSD
ncbi:MULTISPECIES: NAD(P)-dependent oxidoreductase [unclassified Sulfurospirillum]|uniref:NAD-dependent epimerase/dehydratase family protein n=1 Tax=unclassified Sulfurospirillum TaxID=2618290 RepID=UPI00050663D4|nr:MULTISPECIES: NAD(P)-dependent oxidoreductase [unclassified Sulfurospirillum]KFL34039.1 epimerase [Sulfurospirillum sp. SCADC]